MSMESGLINSLWKKITREDESHEENISFADRIKRAYENKNTLEYNEAVNKARELMGQGCTLEQFVDMGEEEAAKLCGPNIIDAATVGGAMEILEEQEKHKINEAN